MRQLVLADGRASMLGRCIAAIHRFVLGPAAEGRLPERARRAISDAQAESEILVGWVQISAILTFAVLYTLSPKAFPPEVPFQPVPWALAAYSLFTILRLVLAYRRRLTPVFLTLSVVVDMAVLLVTIWSFHLQYQEPPGLYVKAPTLMYAFILIALRTLRFEAFYVLLAGAVAAAGWLLLVAYAVLASPDGMPVTRSYAEYMTSYRILLGAEFDKMISLSMVALILAVVVVRAQRLLLIATAGRIAQREMSRFFAPEVAARIRDAEIPIAPGQGVLREAAILVVDIRGFTRLAHTLGPDGAMALLGEYQARLVPVIQAHGGSIDKYLGDGILASFGAVAPSTSHAADAIAAVDAVLAEAAAWAEARRAGGLPAPVIGVGLAAGSVVFGAVGHDERLEYTVIGDAVNLAAKLESHTKVLRVRALTTRETLDLALAQGYCAEAPRQPRSEAVAGVEGPVDLVVLG
jgi:adenylate cyclase